MICDCDIEEYMDTLKATRDYIRTSLKDKKTYKNDEVRKAYNVILMEKLRRMALESATFYKETIEMATLFEEEILEVQPEAERSSKSLLEQQLEVLKEMLSVMSVVEEKPSNTLVVETESVPSH